MNRAFRALAILVDTLGLFAAWPLLTSEPDAASIAWGVVVVGIFTALLILLIKPQIFASYAWTSAKVLCITVPTVAFLGSLDTGSISGHETYAIVIATLIGWLNWTVFRRHADNAAQKAA